MNSYVELENLVRDYLDALYECDTEKLRSVFHPNAIYATADEDPLLFRTLDEYIPMVAARVPPASRNEVRRESISSIDLAGENTAVVRVRSVMGGRSFDDFLTLIRVDGRWGIISKVFHFVTVPIETEEPDAVR